MSDIAPTRFFRIEEWDSAHAKASPYPREWAETRWRPLAETLDLIRLAVSKPIVVCPSGGYRSPEHNKAIGGAPRSQHMEGRAADIVCRGLAAPDLHAIILRLYEGGALPGLSGLGKYDRFVHIDVGGPRLIGGIRRWSGKRTEA